MPIEATGVRPSETEQVGVTVPPVFVIVQEGTPRAAVAPEAEPVAEEPVVKLVGVIERMVKVPL